jgi:hypothetical protein
MAPFMRFLAQCEDDLQRIARFAHNAPGIDDFRQQAWVEARELADERGSPPDDLDAAFRREVLRRLRRKLVDRDRKLRYATRLDHGFDGDDVHPLARRLASDDGRDPLAELLDAESPPSEPEPDEDREPLSLALAWVMFLRRHDQRMPTVASRLLISVSHAYRCCAKARWLAVHQQPIPLLRGADADAGQLGPWRRRRAERRPLQLAFDFDVEGLPLRRSAELA